MKASGTVLEEFYVVEKINLEVKVHMEKKQEKENEGQGAAEGHESMGQNEGESSAGRDAKAQKNRTGRKKKGEEKEETGKKGVTKGSGKGKASGSKKDKGKAPKVKTKQEKDVVYVRDVNKFVQYIASERKLDPSKTTVRVGLDGGQETFKVVVSVFDASVEGPEDDEDEDLEDKVVDSVSPTVKKPPPSRTQNSGCIHIRSCVSVRSVRPPIRRFLNTS